MPSPSTAHSLVTSALRLIGAIAPNETPTAQEANDGLGSLNDLLELWSTQNLYVYGAMPETFPTVAGQGEYTVGPGGNWDTARPVRVNGSASLLYQGVSFEVRPWTIQDYLLVPVKDQRSEIPERFVYVNDDPLGRIVLWPVPSQVAQLTLDTDRVLAQVPDLATALSYPPGYQLALKHELGFILAPDYGRVVSNEIREAGKRASAAIRRANIRRKSVRFDSMLLACSSQLQANPLTGD